jgi:hypothetical protein
VEVELHAIAALPSVPIEWKAGWTHTKSGCCGEEKRSTRNLILTFQLSSPWPNLYTNPAFLAPWCIQGNSENRIVECIALCVVGSLHGPPGHLLLYCTRLCL